LFSAFFFANKCFASQNWQSIDREVEKKVLQVNVGLKIKLQNSLWVQVADISSKEKYYVFTTSTKDFGYQVVGRGSAFPVFIDDQQRAFFVTNKHVLDNARQIKEECEMFYTASIFYAKNYMNGAKNFEHLLDIINLANKKERTSAETKLYKDTINAIWDCYDNNLCARVDPARLLFNKYKKLVSIAARASYFLHADGPVTQAPIEAKAYKIVKSSEPDLAILVAVVPAKIKNQLAINGWLPLDFKVIENEEIQIVGYPAQDNFNQIKEYRPTFSNGRVSKVRQHDFQFTAAVSKGYSGGPVINQSGKTIGIVSQRLLTKEGTFSSNHGAAIKIEELKCLMPALGENMRNRETVNNTVKTK
jgi:hypothetical protein